MLIRLFRRAANRHRRLDWVPIAVARNAERERTSGYIKVSTVRSLAGCRIPPRGIVGDQRESAGQRRLARRGLDPTAIARAQDKDRKRYLAIGESDRMTLKFVKPR